MSASQEGFCSMLLVSYDSPLDAVDGQPHVLVNYVPEYYFLQAYFNCVSPTSDVRCATSCVATGTDRAKGAKM